MRTVTRISEVLIILMLTPASYNASNIEAATPGCVIIPAPTIEIFATSFSIAGIPLTQPIMLVEVIALGCVPIAEYGTPSTMEIPDNLEKYLPYFDAVHL